MSFTPEEIYQEVKKIMPEFEMTYKVDSVRQKIGTCKTTDFSASSLILRILSNHTSFCKNNSMKGMRNERVHNYLKKLVNFT